MRRPALVAAMLAVALLTGCGNKHEPILRGETEGIYIEVGGLKYQVQITRQLNPFAVDDREYLAGLRREDQGLKPDEVWFGLWLRVENDKEEPARSAGDFEIADTQDNKYHPLAQTGNPFTYRPRNLAPGSLNPVVDSAAADSPIQGALLLFKMPRATLENRPLELVIKSPTVPSVTGRVDLDV
jgi:hypothetical protein